MARRVRRNRAPRVVTGRDISGGCPSTAPLCSSQPWLHHKYERYTPRVRHQYPERMRVRVAILRLRRGSLDVSH